MRTGFAKLCAFVAAALLAACGQDNDRLWDTEIVNDDGEITYPGAFIPADDHQRELPTDDGTEPEPVRPIISIGEIGLLAMLNDRELTNRERLDFECGIRTDAATTIIAHRNGRDGLQGTADDNLFDTLGEVDTLPHVGTWTIGELIDCAEENAYLPSPEAAAMLTLLNDRAATDADILDERCAIRRDSAENLMAYRDGADGRTDTLDDDLFHTIDEVEMVGMVGEWTIDRLTRCAARLGYVAPADTGDFYMLAELIDEADEQ